MNDYAVLTNRKRSFIALLHSIVFLGIALHGFLAPKPGILHASGAGADFALILVYLVVASILAWLVCISRCLRERVYFTFCACGATFGLLRTVFGDATLPAAQYLRVFMLSFAVALGALIVRSFSRPVPQPALSE